MSGPDIKQNILVIKTGALGDFVQALGAMAAIRRHHPDAVLTLLTMPPYVSLGQACGYFNHIWLDPRPGRSFKDWFAWRRRMRTGNFTRVYDLQNNDRTTFYFWLHGLRRPEWVGAAWGASHRNASKARTAGHALDGHAQTLARAGITDVSVDELNWVRGDTDRFKLPDPYILLVPGCAPEHLEKRWPAAHYGALARLLDGWGFCPVVIGTREEEDAAAEICAIHPSAISLIGQTSLLDVVLLARHAAAAFGNDTGPMHLIAATGCPVWVFLSAVNNPARVTPKGAKVMAIQRDVLADLSVEDVALQLKVRDFRV